MLRKLMLASTRAVEPEPKQFWMAGAGAWNLDSGSNELYK